jgi:hypothetical protein
VLVRADHAAVDEVDAPVHLAGRIRFLLDGGKDPIPDPG